MSATRMLINLLFGLVLAGGTFYLRQNPEFIRKWMMVQPAAGGGAEMAKALTRDPNAELARLEQEVDRQVNDGAAPAQAVPQSPHTEEQIVSPTALETLQAAKALARQMNGQTQTGNSSEDRVLDQLDADEKGEAAAQAAASANTARNPAAAGAATQPASTVIVMDGTNGYDANAEDKINAMLVPESVKKEILANYRRTGIMPVLKEAK